MKWKFQMKENRTHVCVYVQDCCNLLNTARLTKSSGASVPNKPFNEVNPQALK